MVALYVDERVPNVLNLLVRHALGPTFVCGCSRVGRQSYMEEGFLEPTERESILNKTGYDGTTMVVVEAEVNRIIADRRESNEADLEFMFGLGEVGGSVADGEEEDNENENADEDEDENEDEESRQQLDLEQEECQRMEGISADGEVDPESESDAESAGASRSSSGRGCSSEEEDGGDECAVRA